MIEALGWWLGVTASRLRSWWLRDRDHDPERCEWCRQENGEDW